MKRRLPAFGTTVDLVRQDLTRIISYIHQATPPEERRQARAAASKLLAARGVVHGGKANGLNALLNDDEVAQTLREVRRIGSPGCLADIALREHEVAKLEHLSLVALVMVVALVARAKAEAAANVEFARSLAPRVQSGARSRMALPAARKKSAKRRTKKALEWKENARQIATDYFGRHPTHSYDDAAHYVAKKLHPEKKVSTIKNAIAGVKAKALAARSDRLK